jgi:hypothetical protein
VFIDFGFILELSRIPLLIMINFINFGTGFQEVHGVLIYFVRPPVVYK